MPSAARAPSVYKWAFDTAIQPIDCGAALPTGILIASVAVSVSGADSLLVADKEIRTGSKIVDVVCAAGTAGVTYTVIVDITGNGQVDGQIWKQRVKFAVIVQA